MADRRESGTGWRMAVLLSCLSMEVAVLVSGRIGSFEDNTSDMRMRWCYAARRNPSSDIRKDVVLVAIDGATQERLGRFGAGRWLTRMPFSDQLFFFEEHLKPSVLAYDLLFQDAQGSRSRSVARVSESTNDLKRLAESMSELAGNPNQLVGTQTLLDMNRLSIEQGDAVMAQRMAYLQVSRKISPVLGCYLRGGALDPSGSAMPWTDEDVSGGDPEGNEEKGMKIPYLRDIAIPEQDVHFPDADAAASYSYVQNVSLATRELLGYTYPGFLNGPRDSDGVVRRVPLVAGFEYRNVKKREVRRMFVPSFSLLMCMLHMGMDVPVKQGSVEVHFGKHVILRPPGGKETVVPIDGLGRLYLNYRHRLSDFRTVSFGDVSLPPYRVYKDVRAKQAEKVKPVIDGAVSVVAVSSTAVDIGNTPLEANTPLVHVHLTAVENILGHSFLGRLDGTGVGVLLAVLFLVFTLTCCVVRTFRLAPLTVAFAAAYVLVAFAGVYFGWTILPMGGPLIYVGLCGFSVLSYRFFAEEVAKRRIRGMFSTMVSDKVLSFLEENPDSFSLQGRTAEVTVFFSDVANFTPLAEKMPPDRLTRFINSYLTPVTNCIIEHGGYIDKYIGDGVMAVWGAPYPEPEHAAKACASALRQQEIVAAMREHVRTREGVDLKVRMALCSGAVTAGNMGSERKFQYTVMGDTVNLASRLEAVNKDFGTSILIAESTRNMVKDAFVTRLLGRIRVMGKEDVVSIYELVGETGKVAAEKMNAIAEYERAVDLFFRRKWDDCADKLRAVLGSVQDDPSEFLMSLAMAMKESPPEDTWSGEYVRTNK